MFNKTIKFILVIILFSINTITLDHKIISNTYVSESINVTPEFLLKSPKEGLLEALIYYEVKFPEIVYAQAVLETGNFTSNGCKNKNNLFGLMKNNRLRVFNHWSESVIFYKNRVQNRYKSNETYYQFLNRIGYATNKEYVTKLKQITNDKRRDQKFSNIYYRYY